MPVSSTSSNLGIDDLSCDVVIPQDCKVDDRPAVASLILRSQSQCRTGNAVKLLKNLDLFLHFLSASRHLGFEDIQTMIDLIGDPRQISSLSSRLVLDDCFISDACNLVSICIPTCNPLESSNPRIQSVVAQVICVRDKRPAFTGNVVLFNSFPVNHQCFTHAPAYMHGRAIVKASLIRGFIES